MLRYIIKLIKIKDVQLEVFNLNPYNADLFVFNLLTLKALNFLKKTLETKGFFSI